MKKFFKKLLNLFFPKNLKCIFCGRDIDYKNQPYCDYCKKENFFNNSHSRCKSCDIPLAGENEYCDNCKQNHKDFDKAICPFIYEGNVRKVVLKFKSQNAKYLAEPMGLLMAKRLEEEKINFDIIIPVPLSQKSLKNRGYNQSEMLANEIGKYFNKPVYNDILLKIKETRHQKELGFEDRQKNLSNAFHINNPLVIKDKNILIVDDILTTCATVNTCAGIVKKYSKNTYVVCFARNIAKK